MPSLLPYSCLNGKASSALGVGRVMRWKELRSLSSSIEKGVASAEYLHWIVNLDMRELATENLGLICLSICVVLP